MVNNALRAAYKRNNEWNGETGYYPDHERWLHWNEIIKRVGGQLWKVLEREDLREDREDDFLNHWQEIELNKDRTSPEEKKLLAQQANPPSSATK